MLTIKTLLKDFNHFRTLNCVGEKPSGLYEPAEYIMSLCGKRLRPMLLLLGYRMFRDDHKSAMDAALGVEVFHNFTLLHDDIMDSALLRRGEKAAHLVYGIDSAILSGDVMMIRSFDFLMRSCSPTTLPSVMQLMVDTAREICEGQQLDMDFESLSEVSVEQYLEMNRLKTAVLLAASLKIGGILAGATNEQSDILYNIGIAFGRAFQVQDDLLDVYGESAQTGKKRGGDIVNSKKSYLYVTAIENMTPLRKSAFFELYQEQASNPEVKIQQVLRGFDEAQVEEKANEYIHNAYSEGVDLIDSLETPESRKVLLLEFVASLKMRNV